MPAKKKAKTGAQLRKEALKAIQKLVRLKAADDNGYCSCVTCGVTKRWNEGMQGGHFIPKGSSSYWALEEDNIHPQCVGCNQFGMLHGDAAQRYTIYMQDMYGKDYVDQMLATAKDEKKYSPTDYREMLEEFNAETTRQLYRIGMI
tara:strand:- start:2309 stop:2746 length:438 start_codon:yes stop_codon:yes gene_type:complete